MVLVLCHHDEIQLPFEVIWLLLTKRERSINDLVENQKNFINKRGC